MLSSMRSVDPASHRGRMSTVLRRPERDPATVHVVVGGHGPDRAQWITGAVLAARGLRVCGVAADTAGLVDAIALGPVDVAIVDDGLLPGASLPAVGGAVHAAGAPVLVLLAACPEAARGGDPVRSRARVVLPASAGWSEIAAAVVVAAAHGRTVGVPAARASRTQRTPQLTARERAVLDALARGMTNTEIAQCLDISAETVKTYVSALLRKLHSRNRVDLAVHAHRLGLVPAPPVRGSAEPARSGDVVPPRWP